MMQVAARRRRRHQRQKPLVGGQLWCARFGRARARAVPHRTRCACRRPRRRTSRHARSPSRRWCRRSRRRARTRRRRPDAASFRGHHGDRHLPPRSGAQSTRCDIDHESTPAQWMIRDRQDVVRFLIDARMPDDILMAAALGDLERVTALSRRGSVVVRTEVSERLLPEEESTCGRIDLHLDAGRSQDRAPDRPRVRPRRAVRVRHDAKSAALAARRRL